MTHQARYAVPALLITGVRVKEHEFVWPIPFSGCQMTVVITKNKHICTVELNRPAALNAIDRQMLDELRSAFDTLGSREDIRVVVLQGAQGSFCSGADMRLLGSELSAPLSLGLMKKLGGVILAMRKIPQPVVVKVRGAAWGGGANLALAGDFVLAAHDARFCEVFVNIGTVMDGGGTYFLPRLVGLAKAKELALLGEEFDGKTAASIGLIYKSVPGRQLDRHVNALAEKLSKRPLQALGLIKEGLESSFDMTLPEALDWEASHQAIMFQSEEHRESVRSFLMRKKLPEP